MKIRFNIQTIIWLKCARKKSHAYHLNSRWQSNHESEGEAKKHPFASHSWERFEPLSLLFWKDWDMMTYRNLLSIGTLLPKATSTYWLDQGSNLSSLFIIYKLHKKLGYDECGNVNRLNL